jgi:acetyl esterase
VNRTFFQRLEAGVVRRVIGASEATVQRWSEPRWEAGGHAIDARTQYLMRVGRVVQRSVPSMTPKAARKYYARLCRVLEDEPPVIGRAEDIVIPTRSGERPARVYVPVRGGDSMPGLVYFHGGGHTIGDLETHDTLCRRLCAGAACVVVAIDYRLAPEHPFPAAVEDCDDAYRWVCENAGQLGIRSDRIAVGGDSAGGNLAAVVSFLARDRGVQLPHAQLLIYPGVGGPDHRGRKNPELQTRYLLDAELIGWFADHYIPSGDWSDPKAAPLNLASHAGLPPAIVVTSAFDLLGGEGVEYVEKLRDAGVPVVHQRVTDLPHNFLTMSVLPRAREAIGEIAEALGDALRG